MTQAPNAPQGTAAQRPTFCGTPVTDEEWSVLVEIIDSCGVSRHELARTICEALGWVRPNGRLKARECYEYLEGLEAKGSGEVAAPSGAAAARPDIIRYTELGREQPRREGELVDVSPVVLGLVSNAEERALWRELVERYHYLGHKVAYGGHLRYLVWVTKPTHEVCGCLQFSSAARWLQSRDGYIGWDDATRKKHLAASCEQQSIPDPALVFGQGPGEPRVVVGGAGRGR